MHVCVCMCVVYMSWVCVGRGVWGVCVCMYGCVGFMYVGGVALGVVWNWCCCCYSSDFHFKTFWKRVLAFLNHYFGMIHTAHSVSSIFIFYIYSTPEILDIYLIGNSKLSLFIMLLNILPLPSPSSLVWLVVIESVLPVPWPLYFLASLSISLSKWELIWSHASWIVKNDSDLIF